MARAAERQEQEDKTEGYIFCKAQVPASRVMGIYPIWSKMWREASEGNWVNAPCWAELLSGLEGILWYDEKNWG